uniref:Uncharacterized protein n=1 Tax=Rhizophora mucronata TaxID=61149 RepID=A0A2P2IZC7_RHIMU
MCPKPRPRIKKQDTYAKTFSIIRKNTVLTFSKPAKSFQRR